MDGRYGSEESNRSLVESRKETRSLGKLKTEKTFLLSAILVITLLVFTTIGILIFLYFRARRKSGTPINNDENIEEDTNS